MSNRFTERAQRVILIAQEEAARLNHGHVGTEHLLLALSSPELEKGGAARIFAEFGVDGRRLRAKVEKIAAANNQRPRQTEIPFTPRAKDVLELAVEEARKLHHKQVGTEHLLLGLLREKEGVAAQVLGELGVQLDRVREQVLSRNPDDTRSTIEKRETAFFQALLKKNTASLRESLAEDFILIEALRGDEIDKPSLLAVLESGRLKFGKIDRLGSKIRRYGGAAIAVGETRMAGQFDGAPFAVRSRYAHVYAEIDDSWKMVSAQGTPIPR